MSNGFDILIYMCPICGRTEEFPVLSTAVPIYKCFHNESYIFFKPVAIKKYENGKFIIEELKEKLDKH